RDALAKVITTPQQNTGNQETGRPALYDNAIGDEYQHNLGIQKAGSTNPRHAVADTHFAT
ncbi:hypothetical protein ACUY2U_12910, partial [Corynebacterium phoceense]